MKSKERSRTQMGKLGLVSATIAAVLLTPVVGSAALEDGKFGIRAQSVGDESAQSASAVYGLGFNRDSGGGNGGSDGEGEEPGEVEIPEPEVPTVDPSLSLVSMVIDSSIAGCADITLNIPTSAGGPTLLPEAEISWGDGSEAELTPGGNSHSYSNTGPQSVKIQGKFAGFGPSASNNCITSVDHFGEDTGILTLAGMFRDSKNIQSVASPPSSVTDLSSMFRGAKSFNGSVEGWKTGNVKSFTAMFQDASAFNQDLSSWNTGSATSFNTMFANASKFNGNVSSWDTSKVTNMQQTFSGATVFNQDLSGWKTENVSHFYGMFTNAKAFNGNVSTWKTPRAATMGAMFANAAAFNQDLSGWDVSKVSSFESMFVGAKAFNGNVTTWQPTRANDMRNMFNGASAFNQNISGWDVSKVSGESNFSLNSGLAPENRPVGFAS